MTRRSRRCAGRTDWSRANARPLSRAGPLRRARGDDLRRLCAGVLDRRPISSCCGATARPSFYEPLVGAAAHALAARARSRPSRHAARRRWRATPSCSRPRRSRRASRRSPSAGRSSAHRLLASARTRTRSARARRARARAGARSGGRAERRAGAASIRSIARLPAVARSTSRSAIPVYPAHPVRLMGRSLAPIERGLRRIGRRRLRRRHRARSCCSASAWVGGSIVAAARASTRRRWCRLGAFTSSSSTACSRSAICCSHVWRVERALGRGRSRRRRAARGIARLVGRDTERMDAGACRRAAIESLSESLTDGFTSPLFWYVLPACPASCCSRSSARWTRWSATRRRAICASAGAARARTT